MMLPKIVIGLIIYLIACFLLYRIVRKYDPSITFLETLMPIYNYYLVAKQVFTDPGSFVCVAVLLGIATSVAEAANLSSLATLLYVIGLVVSARLWGLIAAGMGKNFWIYAILSMLGVVHVIVLFILAFDGKVIRNSKFSWYPWKPISGTQQLPPPPPPPIESEIKVE